MGQSITSLGALLATPTVELQRVAGGCSTALGRFVALERAVTDLTKPLAEFFSGLTPEQLEAMMRCREDWEQLPDPLPGALLVLVDNGWYPDGTFSLPGLLSAAESFVPEGQDEANDRLCSHFDEHLEEIEQNLCGQFPERAEIIREAIWAHKEGKYVLSVPVLLAQADGICHELTEEQLYRKANGKPALARVLRELEPDESEFYRFQSIAEVTPLTENTDRLASLGSVLNRHAVLHGLDVAYGNRLNGCRAISVISHVTRVLPRATSHDAIAGRVRA